MLKAWSSGWDLGAEVLWEILWSLCDLEENWEILLKVSIFFYHTLLPWSASPLHTQSNGINQAQIIASKTVSQNHSFLFMSCLWHSATATGTSTEPVSLRLFHANMHYLKSRKDSISNPFLKLKKLARDTALWWSVCPATVRPRFTLPHYRPQVLHKR